ncbi:hypothetical protein BH708_14215 [Brachybacterium sp. P6-10-X1]|uniref:DUF624 domain-containing protein n=1 Tax=Brachybacterium sp. P6-10-X1 TaxID=1903186 RepID=UPI0009717FEA|nr:DUF624 domain-containing protein [Brachybacterium sp. P6-10-X1]APX33678.1 hypothetical protein BH708_14215 [Brachybacterium sp. P6-10-X1]
MAPPRRSRGLFTEITETVYWFLVIDVMLVLTSAPTIVVWTLIAQGELNALLFAIAALPLLPAISGALYTWRARSTDDELVPARRFLHGYRVNLRDSMSVGGPALLVLGLLLFNIAHGDAADTRALNAVFGVLAVLALLVLTRALSIVSAFSFRTIDVYRLTAFTLLTKPLSTLALISLGVLTLGLILVIGEFLLLVTGSLLTFALWVSEKPVAQLLTERFVLTDETAQAE